MKSSQALIILTLLSTVLTACGSTNLNSQSVRAQNMQAQYYNLILKTSYAPDQNGMQYGFDFGFVSYISARGQNINLDFRYSARGRILWVTLIETTASQEQRENVDQSNTVRLTEIATELRHLGAGSATDKANINRIASLLEHPPVRG